MAVCVGVRCVEAMEAGRSASYDLASGRIRAVSPGGSAPERGPARRCGPETTKPPKPRGRGGLGRARDTSSA